MSNFDINAKLNELPIDMRRRAIDRLEIARLRRSKRGIAKLMLFLALLGPGILVMIADNDAGGVITYAQSGSIFGIGFFIPLLVLMIPVAYMVQEMTVRMAAVTRRGHAEMIWRRYGSFWGALSLADLRIANSLTLVTEFIGITFGLAVFGVPPVAAVAAGAAFITTITLTMRYHTWERASLIVAFINLIFIPLVLFAHPDWSLVASTFLTWHINGGFRPLFIYILLANLGTTIAPWMLFFQQSSEVDKGTVLEDLKSGRRDTLIGAVVMSVVAISIMVFAGTLVFNPGISANVTTAAYDLGNILSVVASKVGMLPVKLFAIGLVDAGLISAIALTASTSWAVGEAFRWPKSINLPFMEGRKFYIPGLVAVFIAAGIVLIPHLPLSFLNITVQVIASIFMPAALLFLLLLVNDKEIMGPHVNRRWENAAIIAIMIVLISMSGLYGISLVFPHILGV